jgi:lipopolysaccharide transport system ATP-binding protein
MALAIKIENISKYYKLGVINNGRLWKDLQSYCARFLKKEDPNLPIGKQAVYDRDGFWALSDINLEVEQGDRLGIMGYNGAGKSTLFKILSRITAPTRGCFHVKGRVASLLEVGTGFHGELTGRENIYMNGAILGMKRREVSRKLDEIIAFSEIGPHIDTPVKRYSSGMYVKLGFAIAAHLESEIIIADEVLAVGDPGFQQKAIGKMNDLSTHGGRTVLFVSHNIRAVAKLCNKGLILEHGKIMLDQCPVENAVERYKELLGIE